MVLEHVLTFCVNLDICNVVVFCYLVVALKLAKPSGLPKIDFGFLSFRTFFGEIRLATAGELWRCEGTLWFLITFLGCSKRKFIEIFLALVLLN